MSKRHDPKKAKRAAAIRNNAGMPGTSLLLRALEPRVLLDAAAAATVVQGVADAHVTVPTADHGEQNHLIDALANTPGATKAEADPSRAPAPNAPPPAEVFFIDGAVSDIGQIVSQLPPNAEYHILDSSRGGVDQIAQMLKGRTDIGSIHIMSHGSEGSLTLGDATLDINSMQGTYRDELAAIGQSLKANGDILLYGCDFAKGNDGAQATQLLAALTQADVAASTDTTGSANLGGDWTLEYDAGAIESRVVDINAWENVMAPPQVSTGNNLLTNGSFDSTGGWTSQTGSPEISSSSTAFGSAAFDGSSQVEVEGAVGSTYIQQSVTTVPGQEYTLSWFGHTRTNFTAGNDKGIATVFGATGGDMVLGFTTSRTGWTRYTMTFTASGTSTIVRFTSDGSTAAPGNLATDGTGLLLDAVKLEAAPFTSTYTEDTAGVPVVSNDSVVWDPDSSNLANMTVVIGNGHDGDVLYTTGTLPNGMSVHYDSSTYTLTISGNTTLANYQTVLRSIRFISNSENPDVAQRNISVQVSDGATSSAVASSFINIVAVNDAPVVDLNSGLTNTDLITNGSLDSNTNTWNTGGTGGRVTDTGGGHYEWQGDNTTGSLTSGNFTGWNNGLAPGGSVQVEFDVSWGDTPLLDNGVASTLTITIGGVDYARITTGVSNGANASIEYLNGATGNLSTIAESALGGLFGANMAHLVINLPSSTAATGTLVFGFSSAGNGTDNIAIDNIKAITLTDLPAGVNRNTVYTENGTPTSIADINSSVRDNDDLLQSATVTLTNAQAGDVLSVGTLPQGITSVISNVGGKITITLSGAASADDYSTAIKGITFQSSSDNPSTVNRSVTVIVNDGKTDSAVATTTIAVTAVNDAPVLGDTSLSMSIPEDSGNPSGTVGMLVSDMLGGATDSDNAALGIAIVGADTTGGTWWYASNGTNWTQLGSVSEANARLLAAGSNARVYFQPSANFNGTVNAGLTFRAWDTSTGSNGNTANVTTAGTGGSSAFSTASDTVAVTVTPVNDAPVLTDIPRSITVNEDSGVPVGEVGSTLSTIVGGISDIDPGAVKGLAIWQNSTANGTWYYTTDGGTTWALIGTVSNTNALLLADNPLTRLYFKPNADYNGTTGNSLGIVAWDQSTGVAGSKVNMDAAPGRGNPPSAFSSGYDYVDVIVAPVNDAPVLLDNDRALNSINEDSMNKVDTWIPSFNGSVTDIDPNAQQGIAIIGADATNGTWYFTLNDGATWTAFGDVSNDNALLLANVTQARVAFVPNPDYDGTLPAALTIRAWDRTTGVSGGRGDATINGGSSAFSVASDTVRLTVNAVGDIVSDNVRGNEDSVIVFNPLSGAGEQNGADSFESSGAMITAIGGVAITAGGPAIAVPNGMISLGADGVTLSFTPNPNYNGSLNFTYTVTSGGAGGTETATIYMTVVDVPDSPFLDLDSSTAGNDFNIVYDQDKVVIGNMVSITDADAGQNFNSVVITITNATAGDLLSASGALPYGISGNYSYNASTGVGTYTLSGGANAAAYQTALGQVRFSTTNGSMADRTLSVVAMSSADPKASNTATTTISFIDTDGDGVSNAGDIDSDNDGLLDINEGIANPDISYNVNTTVTGNSSTGSIGPNNSFTLTGDRPLNTSGFSNAGSFPPEYNISTIGSSIRNDYPTNYTINFAQPVQDPWFVVGSLGNASLFASIQFDRQVEIVWQQFTTLDSTGTKVTGNEGNFVVVIHGLISSFSFSFLTTESLANFAVGGRTPALDSDGDGVANRLDLDSDNDGITDNVEAQTSNGYKAPSGIDADRDGLDDAYDANRTNTSAAASVGLTAVDTDGDKVRDYLDSDSDNDTIADIVERGDGQPTTITSTADSDKDGLLDIFEGGTVNDGYDANDNNLIGSNFNLADSDRDTNPNGSNANAPTVDFDYRDNNAATLIDLDGNDSSGASGADFNNTFVPGGPGVAIVDSDVAITDTDSANMSGATVTLTNPAAGDRLLVNGSSAASGVLLNGISWTRSDSKVTFTGVFTKAQYQQALQLITFVSVNGVPTPGVRNITVSVTDGAGASNVANANISVPLLQNRPPINNLPVTGWSTNEDTSIILDGLSVSDADAGTGVISVTLSVDSGSLSAVNGGNVTVTGSGSGTLTLSGSLADINAYLASGSAPRFTPMVDANGVVTLTMSTNDGGNTGAGGPLSDVDTTTINVAAVNDAPVNNLPGSGWSTNEDASLTLSGLSVTDVDAGTGIISVTLNVDSGSLTAVTGGNVTVTGSGTGTLVLSGNLADINAYLSSASSPTFNPATDSSGTVNLTMTTQDAGNAGSGGVLNDVDSRSITVNAVNDAPVNSLPGAGWNTSEDTGITLGGLSVNDVDAGTGNITVTLNVDSGLLTAVTGGNVTVSGSGSGTLMLSGSLADINAYLASAAAPQFTPTADASGAVTLTMTTNDAGNSGSGGALTDVDTRTINVAAVNDAPVNTLPGTGWSIDENSGLTLNGLSVSDVDAGIGNISVTLNVDSGSLAAVAGGNVSVTGSGSGTLVLTGSVADINAYLASAAAPQFTPTSDANGMVTLTMTSSDAGNTGGGGALTDVDTRTITVNAVNNAPVNNLPGAGWTTNEDSAIILGGLSVTDIDAGNGNISVRLNVDSGSLTAVNGGNVTVTGSGSTSLVLSGSLTDINAYLASASTPLFTPSADANGVVNLTMTTNDGGNTGSGGALTDVDSRTITVAAVNDAPVNNLPGSGWTTVEDTGVNLGGLSVTDVDAGAGIINVTLNVDSGSLSAISAGNVTVTGSGTGSLVLSGSVADINAFLALGSTVKFDPLANANGTVTLTMTTRDAGNTGAGGPLNDVDTRTITVTAVNDVPLAGNDTFVTDEDTPVTFDVRGNDSDVDGDTLTVTQINGTDISVGGSVQVTGGSVTLNADGTLTYTPSADSNGTPSFGYTVADGQGGTARATVNGTVNAVNDNPLASDNSFRTNEDTPVTFSVMGNDSDVDGDALSITQINGVDIIVGQPIAITGGTITVVANGVITFTPNSNYNGTPTFSYTVADGQGGTATAQVHGTVDPVNDNPTASDITVTTNEDTAIVDGTLPTASDVDGDTLTYGPGNTGAAHGVVTINADGTYSYTPNPDFNGTDTFSYRVSDGQGGFAEYLVTVQVTAVNDDPSVDSIPDRVRADGETFEYDVSQFFSDPDGDPLNYVITGLPQGLSYDPATGMISGTIDSQASNAIANGIYTITVTAYDRSGGSGLSITGTFNLSVNNPLPTAVNDAVSVDEDTSVTVPVLDNDVDPDGDPLTITAAQAGNGTVTINADGTLTYIGDPNFNGVDTVTYTIDDGNGGISTAQLTVTVNAVNDATTSDVIANQVDSDGQDLIDGNGVGGDALDLSGYFNDVDHDALTFSADGLPPGLSIDAVTGKVSGVVDSTASGESGSQTYTVTVTASDGQGGVTSQTFNWVITNLLPQAVDDTLPGTGSVSEDSTTTVVDSSQGLLANDTDPDGDPLSVVELNGQAIAPGGSLTVTGTNGGSFVVNADGSYSFTIDDSFNDLKPGETRATTITYSVSDGDLGFDTATLTVIVTGVNDAPTADALPNVTVQDGTSFDSNSLTVADYFHDVEGDALTFSASNLPDGLSIDSATGLIVGTLGSDASTQSPYTVTVTATDAQGATVSANIVFTVNNPAPTATNDAVTTEEDTAIDIDVVSNATDPDSDVLFVDPGFTPVAEHGTVTINPDGTLHYVPDADFNGQDTIVYRISDGQGGLSSATVTVTVIADNDAPVATDDTFITVEETPVVLDLTSNDTDADGDSLSVQSINGTLLTPGIAQQISVTNGTVNISADGVITFTPAPDYNGPVSFDYVVTDGNSGVDTGTVAINVSAVNDAPIAMDDAIEVSEDTAIVFDVLGNDSDADGDTLTVATINGVALTPGIEQTIDVPNGTVTITAAGVLTFTPSADYNGPVSFNYTLSDGQGGNNTGTVNFTVTPVNDVPVVVDDNLNVVEDTPRVIDLLRNDSDVDGDSLSIASINGTALTPGVAQSIDVPNGTITVSASGEVTFTPAANYNGAVSFAYEVSDGQGGLVSGTVNLTVTGTNDAPVTGNDVIDVVEDIPALVDLLGNDSDVDGDTLTVESINGIALTPGVDQVISVPNGTVNISAGGVMTFTPSADYNGPASFNYVVSDGQGGTATGTANLQVSAVNDAPVGADRDVTTLEDSALAGRLPVATDVDGDALTYAVGTGPTHGSLVVNADGTYVYTPDADYNGADAFTYTVSDGNTIVTYTISVTVTAVNDAPVGADDSVITAEDTPLTGTVPVATDVDGDALNYAVGTEPGHGSLVFNADGSYVYTPNANYFGADSFTYTVSDGVDTVSYTVVIAVTSVNDVPVAGNDSVTVVEDTPTTLDLVSNDSDVEGDSLSIASINGVDLTPGVEQTITVANGSVTVSASGQVTFTPDANYNGALTFDYQISDGQGGLTTGTVNINVTPVNDAPTGANDSVTTAEDTPLTGNLPAASDIEGDALTYGVSANPERGSLILNADGSYVYTPSADYHGADAFTYSVSDGVNTVTYTVDVLVTSVNDAPVAVNDTATVLEDNSVVLDLLGNDSDVDGDNLSIASINGVDLTPGVEQTITVPSGVVIISASGQVTFTPDANYSGPVSFGYEVSDGQGGLTRATVDVYVTPSNDAPIGANGEATISEDNVLERHLPLATDVDGDALYYSVGSQPGHGTLLINADGSFVYTPEANFSGSDLFSYTVSDGVNSMTYTMQVTVTAVNDAPVAGNDFANVVEDTPTVIDLLGNDSDVDGDSLSIASINGTDLTPGVAQTISVANGTVSISASGEVTFTPNAGYNGNVSFDYQVSDGQGGLATGTASLLVTPVNDAPVGNDGTVTTDEDTAVSGQLPVASDGDGDVLNYGLDSQSQHGSVVINADGSYVYTPDADYNGADSFTYTVSDGVNTLTYTMVVTVVADNDAPVAGNDYIEVIADAPTVIDLLANDSDVDGDSLSIVSINGTELTPGVEQTIDVPNGTVRISSDGVMTFTPNAAYAGSVTFDYVISDGHGTQAGATVNLTVTSVDGPMWRVLPDEPKSEDRDGRNERDETDGAGGFGDDDSSGNFADGSLNGGGFVTRAVNDVAGLSGTTLTSKNGAVSQALNGVRTLGGISQGLTDVDSQLPWASSPLDNSWQRDDVDSVASSAVSADDRVHVQLTADGDQVHVYMLDAQGQALPSQVLMADGKRLPDWIKTGQNGSINISRHVEVRRIALQLITKDHNGHLRIDVLDVNLDSLQIQVKNPHQAPQADRAAAASPFAVQLAQASKTTSALDDVLMKVLGQ